MRNTPQIAAALLSAAGFCLTMSATPAQAADITISAPSCSSWSFTNNTLTCNGSTTTNNPPPAGAPSACSLSASPSVLTAAGSVTLSASCTGTAATSWTFSGGGLSQTVTGASAQVSTTVSATTTFTATPSNGTAGNPVSASVTLQTQTNTAGGGGGGGAGGIVCAGFSSTEVITMPWSLAGQDFSAKYGGFGNGVALVIKFTTGATSSPYLGLVGVAEYVDPPTGRTGTLSTQPCDFGAGIASKSDNTTLGQYFTVANPTSGYPDLQPNTTYYYNVTNSINGQQTCSGGSCNAIINLKKPRGS